MQNEDWETDVPQCLIYRRLKFSSDQWASTKNLPFFEPVTLMHGSWLDFPPFVLFAHKSKLT